MDIDRDFPRQALQTLSWSFGAPLEEQDASGDTLTLEDVRRFLVPRIADLLDRNTTLLMHILYRVDVDERAVQRAFAESAPDDLPRRLADLLIERQMRTVRTRRAYRTRGR